MNAVAVSATLQAHCGMFTLLFVVGVVCAHMSLQQVLSAKSFLADRTNKRALPGVASDVTYEIISTSVFSLAEAADI